VDRLLDAQKKTTLFDLQPGVGKNLFMHYFSRIRVLAVPPETFRRAMALVVGDSMYIAAPLLCNPAKTPIPFEIRRVTGNLGIPGIRVDHQSINVNITAVLMELTLYVSTSTVD
jgi:hypothetical protein